MSSDEIKDEIGKMCIEDIEDIIEYCKIAIDAQKILGDERE